MKTRELTREERESIEPIINDLQAARAAHIENARWLYKVREKADEKMKEFDPNATNIDHPSNGQWMVHIREIDDDIFTTK